MAAIISAMNTTRTPGPALPVQRSGARALAILAAVLLAGCARVESIYYPEAHWTLDDRNVVSISTYASWSSRTQASIPYVYASVRSPESIYFQLLVVDAAADTTPSPPAQSILIRSLTYQLAGAPPVTLIADFGSNVWMQGDPNHNTNNPGAEIPVPCIPGQSVTLRADIVVDDRVHAIDAVLKCESRVLFYPLLLQSA